MSESEFTLHPKQMEIFNDPRRFKAVAAGRRFGKSYLSVIKLLVEGMKDENEYGYKLDATKPVWYVAPTFQQGKDTVWSIFKTLGAGLIEQMFENTGAIKLVNGRWIAIKGSDRPDTLRGSGLSYVVLDEYATMKPHVWEEIIQPALTDVKGGALFIGTPAGKNHFYQLFQDFKDDEDWGLWELHSKDNPFLDSAEIDKARSRMSIANFRKEYEASFSLGEGAVFSEEMFNNVGEPFSSGEWYLAVDPAGYQGVKGKLTSKLSRLDEMAIACVQVNEEGWYVDDIWHGRWTTREASLKILQATRHYKPTKVGIESGALKNALAPYLHEQSRRLGVYPRIRDLSHGGQKKTERITWALQGRLEHGRIRFADKPYLRDLKEQALDFPNPQSHDDLLDALAYIDQIAKVVYNDEFIVDTWEPLDTWAAY